MMVSGVNSSSATMFSNYRLSNASSSQNVEQGTEATKGPGGPGGPGGPKGPKGPPPGGGGKGPEVDTNSDNVWDTDELTSLSEELTQSGATSFDVDQLMDTYDTDGNGVISETEREGIKQNNAFNLPDMKNMQQVMMNGSRGIQIQEASSDEIESATIEDQTVQKMIAAYMQQSEYVNSYVDPNSNIASN